MGAQVHSGQTLGYGIGRKVRQIRQITSKGEAGARRLKARQSNRKVGVWGSGGIYTHQIVCTFREPFRRDLMYIQSSGAHRSGGCKLCTDGRSEVKCEKYDSLVELLQALYSLIPHLHLSTSPFGSTRPNCRMPILALTTRYDESTNLSERALSRNTQAVGASTE